MEKNPKISIIIPVYNVELYLRTAIDSALNQTYENKEIILVDDGSTDQSGKICDEYAEQYDCITVIHQENGGLSAARNTGIANSNGDYIAFLDSDDEYGECDMLQKCMNLFMQDMELEFVQFPVLEYKGDKNYKFRGKLNFRCSNTKEIYNKASTGDISVLAWDKIYRKEIFSIATFPIGRYFEDSWFITDIIPYLSNVAICDYGYYKYYTREGSITNCKFSLKKCQQRLETILKHLPIIGKYNRNSLDYLNVYVLMQSLFFEFAQEYGFENFKYLQVEIQNAVPDLKSLIKNKNKALRSKIIQTALVKFLGIKSAVILYNIKNRNRK